MKKMLFFLLVPLTGCATLNTHSVENTTQKMELQTGVKSAYKFAIQTAMEMSWEISMSDPESLIFSGKTPSTMQRWDDVVNIYISETENYSTITVKSTLGHAPNVEYIKQYLQNVKNKIDNQE
jgi:hypothetical protein